MKELEALKAAIIKMYGEIPAEIQTDIDALESALTPGDTDKPQEVQDAPSER